MSYAWVENEVIRDVCHGNPEECYHPDVAKNYDTEVPDEAVNGDGWVDGELVKPSVPEPTPPEPAPVVRPVVSAVEFMLLFTSPERVSLKALRPADPVLDDFFDLLEDPRLTEVNLNLQSTVNALDYMISIGELTAERKEEILTGEIK